MPLHSKAKLQMWVQFRALTAVGRCIRLSQVDDFSCLHMSSNCRQRVSANWLHCHIDNHRQLVSWWHWCAQPAHSIINVQASHRARRCTLRTLHLPRPAQALQSAAKHAQAATGKGHIAVFTCPPDLVDHSSFCLQAVDEAAKEWQHLVALWPKVQSVDAVWDTGAHAGTLRCTHTPGRGVEW